MRVIYGTSFSGYVRPTAVAVSAGGTTGVVSSVLATEAVAILDASAASASLQASNDGFHSLLVNQDIGPISGDRLVDLQGSIPAAQWRIHSASGGSFGLIYPGRLVSVRDPNYPWGFFSSCKSTNRTSIGGVIFSKVLYRARTSQWSFDLVPEAELGSWMDWYEVTNGFTTPFVMGDPISTEKVYLVKAPGDFPLSLDSFEHYKGSLNVHEVVNVAR